MMDAHGPWHHGAWAMSDATRISGAIRVPVMDGATTTTGWSGRQLPEFWWIPWALGRSGESFYGLLDAP